MEIQKIICLALVPSQQFSFNDWAARLSLVSSYRYIQGQKFAQEKPLEAVQSEQQHGLVGRGAMMRFKQRLHCGARLTACKA